MASFNRWVKDTFFSKPKPPKAIMLGLDAAGKTTFLYKTKTRSDEVVTSIPTIGFNVEAVLVGRADFTCWDVGGCDKIRPLWRHYFENAKILVYFVDCNDFDRLPSAKEEFEYFMKIEEAAGLPVLVVANKQDLPRALNKWEIIRAFDLTSLRDRVWFIQEAVACEGHGNTEILDWIATAAAGNASQFVWTEEMINNGVRKEGRSTAAVFAAEIIPGQDIAKALLANEVRLQKERQNNNEWVEWLQRQDTDGDEQFLAKLQDYSLDIWDHYTHVRMGFLFMRDHGMEEGQRLLSNAIRDYIHNSRRTDSRSFHATMTAFWAKMILYWIRRFSTDTDVEISKVQFKPLLEYVHTHRDSRTDLMDRRLFSVYFNNPTMFAQSAREQVADPDIGPLPI